VYRSAIIKLYSTQSAGSTILLSYNIKGERPVPAPVFKKNLAGKTGFSF
jgi:hypothetical protein